jgi:hypothetical protein
LEDLEPKIRDLIPELDEARRVITGESDPDKRDELFKRYRNIWVRARSALAELSDDKCWYVECRNPGTDDDVDHFRPKARVNEDPLHPGYYWLAFDWHNFRLSCHRANRARISPTTREVGGKADHFPLIVPENRAYAPTDEIDLEMPAILDPTDPADPPMLSFRPNGEADISPDFLGDAVAEERVRQSRLCLHLNWPEFLDQRVMLYNAIVRSIRRGERSAPKPGDSLSPAFKDVLRDLRRTMRRDSEYSSAARVYIEMFKHLWWIDKIVLKGS